MTRPFYTAPSPKVLRDETQQIIETQKTWSRDAIQVIKNLEQFENLTARQIIERDVSQSEVRQALALEYECDDWKGLMELAEVMEHDDFTQISNRAKFLRKAHGARNPIAAERLRRALPALRRKTDHSIFETDISLAYAQSTVAKEYGFDSWAGLRKFVKSNPPTAGFLNTPGAMPPDVAAIVDAVDTGDAELVKKLLRKNRSLVHARVASDITCGDTLLHRADPRATNGSRMTIGHLDVAQVLIDAGIDINAMGGCGDSCFTPPIDASTWIGNRRMVELLIKNGADPNRSYWSMGKPVNTAANHRGKAIFRLLIKAGADYTIYETVSLGFLKLTRDLIRENPELVNDPCEHSTPLVLAAGDPKLTQLLLKNGADPNMKDARKISPLMAAAQARNEDVIDALLAYGAEKDIFFAIVNSDRRAVKRMLKADPSCHKSKYITPLIWAVIAGDKPIVESLLEAGANPNEQQRVWMADNPLVAAAAHQQDHLVQSLLDHGARTKPRGPINWNLPLTAAVRWGTHYSARLLLEAGANPSFTSGDSLINKPLGWCAYVGDLLGAHMLLKFGANRRARSLAFICAAQNGRAAILELLGTLDTDVNHKITVGTAIQRARANKHADCVELIAELSEIHQLPKSKRDAILRPRADFLRLVLDNDSRELDRLLTQRPDLADRELVRSEIFHHAVGILQSNPDKLPLVEVSETLVKHGVPWTIQGAIACNRMDEVKQLVDKPLGLRHGLHASVKFNNVEMLKLFIDAGADVNVKETWGTALHEAVRYSSVEAARLLIESGANVNVTDSNGTTPRGSAWINSRRRDEIRELLDSHGATM